MQPFRPRPTATPAAQQALPATFAKPLPASTYVQVQSRCLLIVPNQGASADEVLAGLVC